MRGDVHGLEGESEQLEGGCLKEEFVADAMAWNLSRC